MSDNTTPTDADAEAMTDAPTEGQTTLLTFQTTKTVTETGDVTEAVHVDVEQDDDDDQYRAEIEQYEALPEKSPLHEKALTACEELDVDTRVIEFTRIPQVRTDDNGDAYVEDKRGLVRFYLGDDAHPADRLVVTQDYAEDARIAEEFTQRKNDLAEMYQVA